MRLNRNDALVIVDIQKDFCRGGALEVPGGDDIVPLVNRLIDEALAARACVVASRDWHPRDHISFQDRRGPWPAHCVQSTDGAISRRAPSAAGCADHLQRRRPRHRPIFGVRGNRPRRGAASTKRKTRRDLRACAGCLRARQRARRGARRIGDACRRGGDAARFRSPTERRRCANWRPPESSSSEAQIRRIEDSAVEGFQPPAVAASAIEEPEDET